MRGFFTFLFCAAIASAIEDPSWVELEFDNFEDTIQTHDWTCVLLYDPWDERGLYEHTLILEAMADRLAQRDSSKSHVAFARLNGRKHALLREEYTAPPSSGENEEPDNPFARDYYDNDDPTALLTLTNETLLDVSLGTPYWPSQFLVLGNDYNMYGHVDLTLILGAIPLKTAVLDRWLALAVQARMDQIDPIKKTRANLEREIMEHQEHFDNDFNFEAYYKAAASKSGDDNEDDVAPRNIRFMLETDSKDNNNAANNYHFTYRKAKVKKVKNSPGYLALLGTVIEEYLAWVEGYEVTWSDERKARQDEQTNFGYYLHRMNQQIRELLDQYLDENHESRKDPKLQSRMRINGDFRKRMAVPNLKAYFQEMIFGSGRNVQGMRRVMEELKSGLGDTPEERRRNRYDFNSTNIPMVPRLREYLTVLTRVLEDEILYSAVLADLLTDWHNILREFHDNLNIYYLQWVEEHPRPKGNEFQFRQMDIIDMEDPDNFDLLANYDYFHETYTKSGTPVILSNVEMTEQEMTLEYIVHQCAASLVTESVQVSRKVGERQAGGGWGGLEDYVLDDELMTHSRISSWKKKNNKGKQQFDSDDFDPEYDEEYPPQEQQNEFGEDDDKSLTMKQFAILQERLDHLYLHDYGLPDKCERILYDDTPYSKHQKFVIPSVIASWDLGQRLPQSEYRDSWPSLFVGKKGTNSKLHIDSGATGFFMFLVSGRKRWVVYNRDERVHLYEKIDDFATYPDVLAKGKDTESDEFLSQRFPLLHRAEAAYEIIQEPGQLVYIPPSCPHAVENLEDIVGLAMNVVPRDGLANHLHEQLHSKNELAAFDLAMSYWLFEDNGHKPMATRDPLYTTYGEYKAQY